MATKLKPTLSQNNKYWISKHRHYELKHFCLQYPFWKRESDTIDNIGVSKFERLPSSNIPGDPTSNVIILREKYLERIKMIEEAAREADEDLYFYIIKAVTEDLSYNQLKSRLDIPCGRDMYYDRCRRFFWLLDKARK